VLFSRKSQGGRGGWLRLEKASSTTTTRGWGPVDFINQSGVRGERKTFFRKKGEGGRIEGSRKGKKITHNGKSTWGFHDIGGLLRLSRKRGKLRGTKAKEIYIP